MSAPGPQILVSTYQGSLENWPIWNIYMHKYKFIFKRKKYRNREVVLHIWGKGWQARRATTCPRSGAGPRGNSPPQRSGALPERSYPTPEVRSRSWEEQPHLQGPAAGRRRRAERSYSTFKVRRGGCEEIPLLQDKQQRLRFARAAVKRYPTSKVRETQIRR